MLAAFCAFHTIETGIKTRYRHRPIDNQPVEITTFRIDGNYRDNRRPEHVTFTANLTGDLARRDFTVNAMAYREQPGLVDLFGGQTDLKTNAFGASVFPTSASTKDALRIMRALRFAAVLGFDIEQNTAQSIHKNRLLLQNIAAERMQAELFKLLCGMAAERLLDAYRDVLAVFMPEIAPMFGFDQHSKYHDSDVWEHSLRAFAAVKEKNLPLRLAALLHDIGKPCSFYTGRGTEQDIFTVMQSRAFRLRAIY